ncbi:receptor-activated Ca2+-permeable cation channel [Coprinopsis marcescibilis]|uniref:Receptor-activated Ca2+-permeable cation channel n=1 Tax=Coprinopsis marcescibilis TaxID=230819 RepID=A0A5C3KZ27_COPMA|nr:receptor-activated Ca2+-permeable cation channel [Coprinopsis marcescibilis]
MDPEHGDQATGLLELTQENLAKVKVFPLIAALRKDVTRTIDSALSWEQLTAADINFSIVRPLVNKYARLRNISVVYACLVVRQYFLAEAEEDLAFAGVMHSRANLCEILSVKLLNRFATHYIQLVAVLTTSWSPLAGATPEFIENIKQNMNADDDDIDNVHNAIEMAITTEAKELLASPITQRVVNDIYAGRVVFTVTANRSLIADNYKQRAIEIYDPKRTPFLDHYRLRVPQYDSYLEFINFAILLLTFLFCLSYQDKSRMTTWEYAFIVFAAAFTLEEYTASTGHGWIIYMSNIWNAFDFSFIVVFLVYIGLRLKGLSDGNSEMSAMAFDVLSCGACILFPRLAFFFVSDNLVILSLRAMIAQFAFFITIAAICFSGLLFTLWTMAKDNPNGKHWSVASISWLMVQIWFGNTSLSFNEASSFHPLFGPILMTVFAAMSNTLLLTILISILSNTVARIDANATKESLFQHTVATMEGVKSDALFSYQPPFNLLAFAILKPLSWFLTPRQLHTANVFLIRLTSLPQLFAIGIYERYFAGGRKWRETSKDAAQSLYNSLPRHIKNMPLVEALMGSTSNDLFDAIFDVEVSDDLDPFETEDELDEAPALRSQKSRETIGTARSNGSRARANERKEAAEGSRNLARSASRQQSRSPAPAGRLYHRPASIKVSVNEGSPTTTNPPDSPSPRRQRVWSMLSPLDVVDSPDVITTATTDRSPLARLYNGSRFPSAGVAGGGMRSAISTHHQTEVSMKRLEQLFEDAKELPVQKLKEEMKELQDRQARIENLLLMLTRGMRNEMGGRQGTL